MVRTRLLALGALVLGASLVLGADPSLAARKAKPAASAMSDTQQAAASSEVKRVSVKSAVLRSGPSTSSKRLATMRRGSRVHVLAGDSGGEWLHVRYGKRTGYVANKLVH